MSLYNSKGEVISSEIIDKKVTTTVLGSDLPDEYQVTSAYANAMKNAITLWGSEYAGDDSKIPFIVHTDQHGRLNNNNKGVFDLLSYLVNMDEVSAVFNLGDTVVDHWEDDTTNVDPLLRNSDLEAALKCTKSIPLNKQINLFGNHDTWYTGNVETEVSGVLPSLKYLNPYFKTNGLRTIKQPNNSGNMEIYDDKKKVRYVVIGSWDYSSNPNTQTYTYQGYWINDNNLTWIINELEKNTGYDLVIISHIPLEFIVNSHSYDPITGNPATENSYILYWSDALNVLWNARKNKTSGSVNINGNTLTFDFSNCTDNLLLAMAGHTHCDGVNYIDDGLLQVVFDEFNNQTIHFGLLDRINRNIQCWKLSNDNNTPLVQHWLANFDYTT